MRQVTGPTGWSLEYQELPRWIPGEVIARTLYPTAVPSIWLDSSHQAPESGRFSFLADACGPLSEVLSYRVGYGSVIVTTASGVRTEPGRMLDLLEARLAERAIPAMPLPFDFQGGYLGYLGYELRADCGFRAGRHHCETPDAGWIFADRWVALDHRDRRVFLMTLHDGTPELKDSARQWRTTSADTLLAQHREPAPPNHSVPYLQTQTLRSAMSRGPERYQDDVRTCLEYLRSGESYEICLTDNLHLPFTGDDLDHYLNLREHNPAPYSALLRMEGFAVFCSSPECFLAIDRHGRVRSKPIKGTAARDDDPATDRQLARALRTEQKTLAENLMIVDLIRNDLSRVCRPESIRVDPFAAVESYRTVHQLVSTVHGELRPGSGAIDCIRHCFPGGSMTGAPKARTMELIDLLEDEPRGIYSGTIGYLGLNGTAALNIVIRSAVRVEDRITIGAGGAIVLDSNPAAELDEMLLKAAAPLRGLALPEAPNG